MSDRLSARLDDVEPALVMSMENIAKLIADLMLLQDRVQAMSQTIDEQRSYIDRGDKHNDTVLDSWKHRRLLNRLRWLIRGA